MLFTFDDNLCFWARVEEWEVQTGKFLPVYAKNELSAQGRPTWVDPVQVAGFNCYLETLAVNVRIFSGPEVGKQSHSKKWVHLRFAALGIWRMCAFSERVEGDGLDSLRTPEALQALDLHAVLITSQKALLKADRRNDFQDPASKGAVDRTLRGVESLMMRQDRTLPWEAMTRKFSIWLAQKLS
jgi:hypothetical protein